MRRLVPGALGAIAVAALVLIVFGLGTTVLEIRSPGASGTPSAVPVQQSDDSTGSVTLILAGDIARCSEIEGAAATAELVSGLAGTVMTVGDNAYESATEERAPRLL